MSEYVHTRDGLETLTPKTETSALETETFALTAETKPRRDQDFPTSTEWLAAATAEDQSAVEVAGHLPSLAAARRSPYKSESLVLSLSLILIWMSKVFTLHESSQLSHRINSQQCSQYVLLESSQLSHGIHSQHCPSTDSYWHTKLLMTH